MKYFALLGVLLVAVACGSKSDHGGFVTPDSGGADGAHAGHTSTDGGSTTGGSGGSGGGVSVLAPIVEITTPLAAADPNVDSVLVEDQVTVLCTAKASTAFGAKPVDASTVTIEMFDADGKSVKSSAGIPTKRDQEYSASFVLAALPSGNVSFHCSATDTSASKHIGTASVDSLVDRGPTITIVDPEDKSAQNLLGPMNVEFTTAALPVLPGDKQADVSGVTLTVGGVKLPTVDKGQGKYQATVDFTKKELYDSPPSGVVPIVITASNKRKAPGKATHTLSYSIVVDGVGPVITIVSPAPDAVVGRASVMNFIVTDKGTGIDRSTVAVKLNQETRFFSATDKQWVWDDTTGNFSFNIGAVLATHTTDTQVTVNVLASDKAGNASTGNSRLYNLDYQPPIVDLDPEGVYEKRPGNVQGENQCSELFDPVGRAAPSDLEPINKSGVFRALVWDQTNLGGMYLFFAFTAQDSVRLYVQPNTDSPLLYDASGKKKKCDEIYTGSAPYQHDPADKPLPFLKLVAVPPAGAPAWGGTAPPPSLLECKTGSDSASQKLCGIAGNGKSDMTVVIRHPTGTTPPFEPVIYAIQPVVDDGTSVQCTGRDWVVTTAISAPGVPNKLGWVCMAARAEDKVGNVGISPPLRICLDDGTNPHRCDSVPPPSCTDGCTPPLHFATRLVRHD